MKREEVLEKVKEIITDKLGVVKEEVKERAELDSDLGADSLDMIELAMEFEKAFAITIPDKDLDTMHHGTVSDAVDLIQQIDAVDLIQQIQGK